MSERTIRVYQGDNEFEADYLCLNMMEPDDISVRLQMEERKQRSEQNPIVSLSADERSQRERETICRAYNVPFHSSGKIKVGITDHPLSMRQCSDDYIIRAGRDTMLMESKVKEPSAPPHPTMSYCGPFNNMICVDHIDENETDEKKKVCSVIKNEIVIPHLSGDYDMASYFIDDILNQHSKYVQAFYVFPSIIDFIENCSTFRSVYHCPDNELGEMLIAMSRHAGRTYQWSSSKLPPLTYKKNVYTDEFRYITQSQLPYAIMEKCEDLITDAECHLAMVEMLIPGEYVHHGFKGNIRTEITTPTPKFRSTASISYVLPSAKGLAHVIRDHFIHRAMSQQDCVGKPSDILIPVIYHRKALLVMKDGDFYFRRTTEPRRLECAYQETGLFKLITLTICDHCILMYGQNGCHRFPDMDAFVSSFSYLKYYVGCSLRDTALIYYNCIPDLAMGELKFDITTNLPLLSKIWEEAGNIQSIVCLDGPMGTKREVVYVASDKASDRSDFSTGCDLMINSFAARGCF